MRLFRYVFYLALGAALAAGPAPAQDAGYYADLRAWLQDEYAITGGAWVLGPSESAALAGVQVTDLTVEAFAPDATVPFGEGRRLTTPGRAANPWEQALRFPTQAPIAQGDRLLLVAWLRGLDAERGHGRVTLLFEETEAPYSKSFSQGALLAPEWQRWVIPFEAHQAFPTGAGRFQINAGGLEQSFELGGVALLNLGPGVALDALPRSEHHLSYAGRAPEAAWRAEAEARIREHRMAPLHVRVEDASGAPVPGAAVHARMQRHAFGFGTAVAVGRWLDNPTYRQRLTDLTDDGRTFNLVVIENALKWPPWENPHWPTDQAGTVAAVNELHALGFDVRGHTLVWPGWRHLPDDLEANQNNPDYLRQRIRDHIAALAGHDGLRGMIREWDVVNEPVHVTDLQGVLGGEAVAEWFQLAAAADSSARRFINEYSVISASGMDLATQEAYLALIQQIEADGGRIDGVGIQGHMGYPLTPPTLVYEILDTYAALGKPLAITEYDAAGVDEATATDYLRDLLTATFSHPSVESFLMWGFWDGAHWYDDAPLFRQDWSLKPSGQAFFDLVFDEWWTDEAGVAGTDGTWTTPGFLGDYAVAATSPDGAHAAEVPYTLATGADTLVVRLDAVTTGRDEGEAPEQIRLDAFPNPAIGSATVRFTLPNASPVTLVLYDLLGREVIRLVDGVRPAGRHTAPLDAAALAPGAYLLRLDASGATRTRPLVLAH